MMPTDDEMLAAAAKIDSDKPHRVAIVELSTTLLVLHFVDGVAHWHTESDGLLQEHVSAALEAALIHVRDCPALEFRAHG